ncbi:diaminopimelate decarboxylase [Kocuria turfanensis]|uniref:Diaminopimelate decarboxylase n=1 Tax=Kocuria turfanensis TaxID=388357 RepID=A0A512I8M0_9MICC|nr:diaminopimelate decarboxylase [Kocuria turfanensis]GEO94055.1 diaminopimelate decarboxylase [Kocuria turfanensis]
MTADPTTRTGGSPLAPQWLSVPEDLDALDPAIWPEAFRRDAEGVLTVAGIPATELAERYGTPSYVYSEDTFRARAREFRAAFTEAFARIGAEVSVYYAGKSFLTTEVVRWIREEGLNVDTSSGGELAVALRGGMEPARIALHGNNKSAAEITRALDNGLGRIVVDSLAEIELVAHLARTLGVVAPVMIRVTPGVHASTHEFIATAHEDQKFGLSLAAPEDGGDSPAMQAVAACVVDPDLDLRGLHCHIGSQIFDADGFGKAAERVLTLMAQADERFGLTLPELDLGGGYGIAYTEADTPRPAREIAESLADQVAATARSLHMAVPHLSIEPGRAISGPSACTLYTVGTLKTVTVEDGARRRYVSVDGGMSDNARPVLYGADYTAVLANRRAEGAPVLSRVVGKHCESGDVVVRDVYLPEDLAPGDVLAVPATGAYCWALASNYNWIARPPVVAVRTAADGPEARLIVRGETEEDLFARDLGA